MKKSLIQIGSLLLLLVFSVIQVLPAFHLHTETVNISHSAASDGLSASHVIDNDAPDCLICDFIANKQLDYPSTFEVVGVSILGSKPVTLNADYSQQLFETAVHTWSNKGPPIV